MLPFCLLGCAPTETPAPSEELPIQTSALSFVDRQPQSGVTGGYQNGEQAGFLSIAESLGGGLALLDFDSDDRFDLFLPQGGSFDADMTPRGLPSRLYRGLEYPAFGDVSSAARLDAARHYSHGAAACDFNNDGFPDVLVTGYGGLLLWLNCGDGTFHECGDAVGLQDTSWSSSAGWGDLNGDGAVDLYVARYVDWSPQNNPDCGGVQPEHRDVCPPRRFNGLDDSLYLSTGDGRFVERSKESGLLPAGKGLGVLLADLDEDLDLDIYVTNDTVENFLYLNDGDGQLTEAAALHGVSVDHQGNANGSMGIALTDADGDGRIDLWVANYESELFALYRHLGGGQYLHSSTVFQLNRLGTLFVGFGTASRDFDLDGDEDLIVANGHVIQRPANAPVRQVPLLLVNDERKYQRFEDHSKSIFSVPKMGRGLVTGDLNRDGLPDFVISNTNEPYTLAENQSLTDGQSLTIRLTGTRTARFPAGTVVTLNCDGRVLHRQFAGGGSYLSSGPAEVHFGIPARLNLATASLAIRWPNGALFETHLSSILPPENSTPRRFVLRAIEPDILIDQTIP